MPLNPGMTPFAASMDPAKYEVLGSDQQSVSIGLDKYETIQTEPGSMMWMDDVCNVL